MDCYLKKLAADQTTVDDFAQFLKSSEINKEAILEIINALKCKLEVENMTEYFRLLKLENKKLKRSEILNLSHVVCKNCDFYKQSSLCDWKKNNPELFETEVYFFYNFFKFFDDKTIENDLDSYPLKNFLIREKVKEDQTIDEKIKLLNTIIKNYEYL